MADKRKIFMAVLATLCLTPLLLIGCGSSVDGGNDAAADTTEAAPGTLVPDETAPGTDDQGFWTVGFGSAEIAVPEDPKTPLYIAGYNQGWEITGIRDLQRASAVWLEGEDAGGVLIISVDCVALSSNYVKEIRSRLSDFSAETGCLAINVISTHTHAGLDTLGLWGPIGEDGKNAEFMENLMQAAVKAAKDAYADRSAGTLGYASVKTVSMQRDSRDPQVYDDHLHQLRFTPLDQAKNSIRMMFYDAHPESLRGANTVLSSDFPGVMRQLIAEETGDDMLFLPGAIGGLIMTKEFTVPFDAEKNLEITGQKLADYALSMKAENDLTLSPRLDFSRVAVEVPVENQVFLYYKSLNILQNEIAQTSDGYMVYSELNAISLGGKEGVLLNLVPGEIFPELVYGNGLKTEDPASMLSLARAAGYAHLLTVSLANDELGYIVPPSDFIVNPTNPYFERYTVNGEDHYEETNSVGPQCAEKLSEAFTKALEALEN